MNIAMLNKLNGKLKK